MSLASWTIILSKIFTLRFSLKRATEIVNFIETTGNLNEVISYTGKQKNLAVSKVFRAIHRSFSQIKQHNIGKNFADRIFILDKTAENAIALTINSQDKGLVWLFIIGNSSPFIGLFGTVIGITNSFREISVQGASSFSVVAPGISEALLATAAGLFVAIPALIFYNYFKNQIRILRQSLAIFSNQVIQILEK